MAQCKGFTASKYDPEAWADLFRCSGARYAVLSNKHHDGVAQWTRNPSFPSFLSVKKSPRHDSGSFVSVRGSKICTHLLRFAPGPNLCGRNAAPPQFPRNTAASFHSLHAVQSASRRVPFTTDTRSVGSKRRGRGVV